MRPSRLISHISHKQFGAIYVAKFCYLDSSLSINYLSSFTEEIKGALRSLNVDAQELEVIIMTS
jgi:hypothetical protein